MENENYNFEENINEYVNSYVHEDGSYYYQQEPQKKPKKGSGKFLKFLKGLLLIIVFTAITVGAFSGSTKLMKKISFENKSEEKVAENANIEDSEDESNTLEDNDSADNAYSNGTTELGAVNDVSVIVENAMPSIVSITSVGTVEYQTFFGKRTYQSEGAGSGVIVSQDDKNLYVATNNHVVNGADSLTVTFIDGETVSATIRGQDSASDLAVLEIDMSSIKDSTRKEIRTAVFASSKKVKAGELAIAIGNSLGYGQTVTSGIISALDREVTVTDDSTGHKVTNYLIQTDAAINPGNSGGALLNINGEVIGINSAKTAKTEVEGMGYAIPSSTALPIIQELVSREKVKSGEEGYLGISAVDVTDEVANTYSMPKGVFVSRVVSGSSAERDGLKQGDVIVAFAGRNVATMEEIQEILSYYSAGTSVEIVVQRSINGTYQKVELTVELGNK